MAFGLSFGQERQVHINGKDRILATVWEIKYGTN